MRNSRTSLHSRERLFLQRTTNGYVGILQSLYLLCKGNVLKLSLSAFKRQCRMSHRHYLISHNMANQWLWVVLITRLTKHSLILSYPWALLLTQQCYRHQCLLFTDPSWSINRNLQWIQVQNRWGTYMSGLLIKAQRLASFTGIRSLVYNFCPTDQSYGSWESVEALRGNSAQEWKGSFQA